MVKKAFLKRISSVSVAASVLIGLPLTGQADTKVDPNIAVPPTVSVSATRPLTVVRAVTGGADDKLDLATAVQKSRKSNARFASHGSHRSHSSHSSHSSHYSSSSGSSRSSGSSVYIPSTPARVRVPAPARGSSSFEIRTYMNVTEKQSSRFRSIRTKRSTSRGNVYVKVSKYYLDAIKDLERILGRDRSRDIAVTAARYSPRADSGQIRVSYSGGSYETEVEPEDMIGTMFDEAMLNATPDGRKKLEQTRSKYIKQMGDARAELAKIEANTVKDIDGILSKDQKTLLVDVQSSGAVRTDAPYWDQVFDEPVTMEDVYAKVMRSVVEIDLTGGEGGTAEKFYGIAVGKGLVLAPIQTVQRPGGAKGSLTRLDGTTFALDGDAVLNTKEGFALLKVASSLTPLTLSSGQSAAVGDNGSLIRVTGLTQATYSPFSVAEAGNGKLLVANVPATTPLQDGFLIALNAQGDLIGIRFPQSGGGENAAFIPTGDIKSMVTAIEATLVSPASSY